MTRAISAVLAVCLVTQCVVASEPVLGPRVTAEGVELTIRAPGARHVSVAGSFQGWADGQHELTDPEGDGIWTTTVKLPPGRHEYLFFVDGQAAFRGGRMDAAAERALTSHEPIDVGLHWLVPVSVCSISASGAIVTTPEQPGVREMFLASAMRLTESGRVDAGAYRRAVATINRGEKLAPGNPWMARVRPGLESRILSTSTGAEVRDAASEQRLEAMVAPALASEKLFEKERRRLLEAARKYFGDGSLDEMLEEVPPILVRAAWRDRLPRLEREWRADPGDWRRIIAYAGALTRAQLDADPAGLEKRLAEIRVPLMADPAAAQVEQLTAGLRLLNTEPEVARQTILDWLRAHGFTPGLVALSLSLFPKDESEQVATWTLERLSDLPDLAKQYLFWALSFSPRLREHPGVDARLEGLLAKETDPLVAGRLAVRLFYIYVTGHREEEAWSLLERQLRANPESLELLENFRALMTSFDNLERQYSGMLANPWRPGMTPALERLESIAPSNLSLLLLLARELARAGREKEARQKLGRVLGRTPWDGVAALELARLTREGGDSEAALQILERCRSAGCTDLAVTRETARAMGAGGHERHLKELLEGTFSLGPLAEQALSGGIEGLREKKQSAGALAFLSELRPMTAGLAAMRDRARVRLSMDTVAPSALEQSLAPWLAAVGGRREQARLLMYASWAALTRGHAELHARLLGRALRLEPRRRWLLDALTGPLGPEIASAAVSLRGLSEMGPEALAEFRRAVEWPGPFARHEARAAMAEGRPWDALEPLSQLECSSVTPEQLRGARAGLAMAALRSGQIPWAVAALWRLARSGVEAGFFLAVAFLLPVFFTLALATRGRKPPPG